MLSYRSAALSLLVLLPAAAQAVTVAEALEAERVLTQLNEMAPDQRSAFIGENRGRINQALMDQQIVAAIRHTVQLTALASQHIYHRPLMCGLIADEETGDDDQEVGGAPPLPPPAPLPEMVEAFKTEIKAVLHLPDSPVTEARLAQIDVAEVIANRMLADYKCTR